MRVSSYDHACERLARHFLQDEPEEDVHRLTSLSLAIQQAVEEWFAENPPLPEPE